MPTPDIGVISAAAFRLMSRQNNPFISYPGPAVLSKLNSYDKIALLKHSLKNQTEFEQDDTLDGSADFMRNDRIAVMPAGSIDIAAGYLGLDALIAGALGVEKFRGSAVESPAFGVSGTGAAITGTTAAGCTGTTLATSGTPLTNNSIIGDWVRIQELTTTPNVFDQVRKIVGWTSTSQATIAPAWNAGGATDPAAGKAFAIAREFLHTFECARNLHGENFQDIMTGAWGTALGTTKFLNRHGVFVTWTGNQYEEWQYCFIKKLTFKLDTKKGLMVSAELVPVLRSYINPSTQDRTLWEYVNGSPAVPMAGASFMVYERVLFPDAALNFKIGAFSTSSPLSASTGISEFELTIENPLDDSAQSTDSGLLRLESMRSDRRKIYGSFALPRWATNERIVWADADTDLMASLTFTGSTIASGISNALTFWMRRMRLETPDVSKGGVGVTPEKHSFRLLRCDSVTGNPNAFPTPTTGAGIENGPLIIQTRNQNPFNAFMDQNKE